MPKSRKALGAGLHGQHTGCCERVDGDEQGLWGLGQCQHSVQVLLGLYGGHITLVVHVLQTKNAGVHLLRQAVHHDAKGQGLSYGHVL